MVVRWRRVGLICVVADKRLDFRWTVPFLLILDPMMGPGYAIVLCHVVIPSSPMSPVHLFFLILKIRRRDLAQPDPDSPAFRSRIYTLPDSTHRPRPQTRPCTLRNDAPFVHFTGSLETDPSTTYSATYFS